MTQELLEKCRRVWVNLEFTEFKSWYGKGMSDGYIISKYRKFQDDFMSWLSEADEARRLAFIDKANSY